MQRLLRADRAPLLEGVEESLSPPERAGLQILFDVLGAEDLAHIRAAPVAPPGARAGLSLRAMDKNEVEKHLTRKYMESVYSVNFNIKDDGRVKDAELQALHVKFRHFQSFDFAKLLRPEAIAALQCLPDSNLTSAQLEAILDALRALLAYYNLSERISETKRSFAARLAAKY